MQDLRPAQSPLVQHLAHRPVFQRKADRPRGCDRLLRAIAADGDGEEGPQAIADLLRQQRAPQVLFVQARASLALGAGEIARVRISAPVLGYLSAGMSCCENAAAS